MKNFSQVSTTTSIKFLLGIKFEFHKYFKGLKTTQLNLLNLNIFHTLFWCFHCTLLKKHMLAVNYSAVTSYFLLQCKLLIYWLKVLNIS